MRNSPPPDNQLYPEDFVQQFHNSHMYEEPGENTGLGCELRYGKHFASGGEVIDKALSIARHHAPLLGQRRFK